MVDPQDIPPVDVAIVIAHPGRSIGYESALRSLTSLIHTTRAAGHIVATCDHYGALVAKNRNRGAVAALDAKAKWLLFLDDDMVLPPDTILRLMAHDVDAVAGMAVSRQPPFITCFFTMEGTKHKSILEWPENTLMQIDAVGAACLLVRATVFEKLTKPFFAEPPLGDDVMGEDMYFCLQLRDKGVKIHLDTSLSVGHVGDYIYTIDDFFAYREAHPEIKGGT